MLHGLLLTSAVLAMTADISSAGIALLTSAVLAKCC
jgi:hypothetical protein